MKKIDIKIKNSLKELNLIEEPVCIECSSKVKFVNSSYKHSEPSRMSEFGGWKLFCSVYCSRKSKYTSEKRKKTNIIRYGESSWAKSKVGKEILSIKWEEDKKLKFKLKSEKTSLEKYGVTHYSKTEEYLIKRKKTSLEKYGVDNTFKLVEKIKESNIKKYGVSHYNLTEEGRITQSKNSAMKSPEISMKSKINRMLSSITNPILREVLIHKNKELFVSYISSLGLPNRYEIANKLDISYSYLNNIFRQFDIREYYLDSSNSHYEKEIYDWLKSVLDTEIILNDRSQINPFELDIYIPSKKLAIEFNGIYYHSEFSGKKDKNYHLNKTVLCETSGIQLLHIFENEWLDITKQNIWKSIILNKLGLISNRIYARKCSILEIKPIIARKFLDENHLSGFCGAEKHIGLVYNNKLVSVMSSGKSRFKSNEYEIIRFASLLETVVVGGMSKLLKLLPENTITYADRRYSSLLNSGYNKFFNKIEISSPNWWGFNKKDQILKHRMTFQKHKLEKLLCVYNKEESAFDNMINNEYDRIWDCGNYKFSNYKSNNSS